jgi:tetratricopeptide (TPR) repeat protein
MTAVKKIYFKFPAVCRIFIVLLLFLSVNLTAYGLQISGMDDGAREDESVGSIKIIVDLQNVRVLLNGEIQGLAHPGRPLERHYIPAGQVTLTVEAGDIPPQTQSVMIQPGKTAEAVFRLRELSPDFQQLMEQADRLFDARQWLTPDRENAFQFYQTALDQDPKNPHAREKIQAMMGYYKREGEKAEAQQQFQDAQTHFQNYLKIAEYVIKIFDSPPESDIEDVRAKVNILNHLARPIDQLIEEGDALFNRQRYMAPENENAFENYQTVLTKDPGNFHARGKIYEMMQIYKNLAGREEKNSYKLAQNYYKNYLTLIRCAAGRFNDGSLTGESERVQEQIRKLEGLIQASQAAVKKADAFFIAQRFTNPEGNNAFTHYQSALEIDPTNETAQKRILEIMDFYETYGNDALQEGRHLSAKRFYSQYLPVAEYALKDFGDVRMREAYNQVQNHLQTIASIEALLDQGNAFFAGQRFLLPEKENAFEIYQEVLRLNPENRHALGKIRAMIETYHAWAEEMLGMGRHDEAMTFFERYLLIARYMLSLTQEPDIQENYLAVQARMHQIHEQIWADQLQKARKKLAQSLETYNHLKEKEAGNVNVTREMVDAMKILAEDLKKIEKLYQKAAQGLAGISEKIEQVKKTRESLEAELAVREARFF